MSENGRRWAGPAAVAVALLGVYVAGTSAVLFRPEGSDVAFWWPAAGISVALVALVPRRHVLPVVLGIFAVSLAANLSGGQTADLSLAYSIANAAEALVAGMLLKGPDGRLVTLGHLSDFVRLVVAAVVGALVVGVLGALAAYALDDGSLPTTLRNIFTSHMAATMVIVPVAMTWRQRTSEAPRLEFAIQVLWLAAVTCALFIPVHSYPLSFALLPILVWAGLRLSPRAVTIELLVTCLVAILLTGQGRGPFGDTGPAGAISLELAAPLVQGFILAGALVVLPLTMAVTQRRLALEVLTERERLFRRNFTESMTGMLLLSLRGDRLEIVDANETALQLLDDGRTRVVGRYLDRVLSGPSTLRSVVREMVGGDLDGWRGQVSVPHRPTSHVKIAISPLTRGADATFSAQLLDVSAEYAALARTAAAERLTSATLDTTHCIILVCDMDGTVVRANRATSTLTGFHEDEVLGRPVWESIIPPHRVPIVRSMFSSPDGSAIPGSREADVQTAAGDVLRIVWNTDLVRDEDGTPRYAVMTGIDVTTERTTAGLMNTLFQAGMSTAIIGMDGRGRITLFNSGAQALLGWTTEQVRGRQFTDLLDPTEMAERTADAHGSGWSALTSTIGEERESQVDDWTWLTAGGSRRTVSMTLSGGGSEFGPQAGYLVVGRDVTEQRHSQMMLMAALEKERTASERLRQLDAAKNEFVSTVSHELRTPVTSIVGYTELLADGSPVEPDPQQVPLLDTIARNGHRLISLCNDLLTLAGLDSDGPAWNRAPIDVRDLVTQAEDSLRPMVRDRHLKLSFVVPEQPVVVVGDAIQLERVLLNLLSNALKFTPDGGLVTTSLEVRDGEAWLLVVDTGIGIPHEEQEGLFQKFFRASTAQDLAIQGTGLGLSIVAGILAVHGGRIGVESAPGEGTTFTVRLPLQDG
ncbi:ATP-binding protein [Nocardioides euryhalodurans]|nr:ATP-binding protein [Nocardioides euryhalodurans]